MEIIERREPEAVRFRLTSKGIGSSNTVETALTLTPADAQTRVRWTAEVTQLGGLLKMVPSGLIRGAAQKVIEDVLGRHREEACPAASLRMTRAADPPRGPRFSFSRFDGTPPATPRLKTRAASAN